ncbi:hydrolase [Virgibacillus profundi]|uniref:Hydrolase n=1 Tax=Virgibacillus profundi TaxID=2024555 RepID=A0A2A2IJ66_9BACI|nr:SGNH/GDSL hydrolase family protein [Virgibacillus profundi]PAV31135.1 hydrolase [Virgibacillus profundi]PXY55318.1 hydrolase [Virgibacillus profundi]
MSKRIIFIGDSITESGRKEDPEKIGIGYVRILHDYLKITYPAKHLTIVNQGVGGNRITDLASRWETDVIALNPDIVSVSIGINDVWRQLDRKEMEQVYPEQFEQVYHDLLSEVKAKTNATIILMEPTVIEENIHSEGNTKLIPYVNIVQRLAKEFQTIVVPTHKAFIDYLQTANEYKLTTDGVHMNSGGNMLMAMSWLKEAKNLLDRELGKV